MEPAKVINNNGHYVSHFIKIAKILKKIHSAVFLPHMIQKFTSTRTEEEM